MTDFYLILILIILIMHLCYVNKTIERIENKLNKCFDANSNDPKEVIIQSPDQVLFYPTTYSTSDQRKRRNKEVKRYNLNEDYRGYAEWSDTEDQALRYEWLKDKMNIQDIAKRHKRSYGSIQARLKHLSILT